MIKDKDLSDVREDVRYKDGSDVTLDTLQEELNEAAKGYQIPVAFKRDQIKSGGLLSSTTDDCLVVHHPEHPNDYFNYAIYIRRQGVMAYVSVKAFGKSTQLGKQGSAQYAKEQAKEGSLGWAALGAVMSIGKNKGKLEAESNYYQSLETIIDEVIS